MAAQTYQIYSEAQIRASEKYYAKRMQDLCNRIEKRHAQITLYKE